MAGKGKALADSVDEMLQGRPGEEVRSSAAQVQLHHRAGAFQARLDKLRLRQHALRVAISVRVRTCRSNAPREGPREPKRATQYAQHLMEHSVVRRILTAT
jgi:hypothetical protein